MHEKKQSKAKSILRFAEDKGFYIILSLCIVAIGVSGYVLFFTGGDDTIPVVDPITLEDSQPTQATQAPTEATKPVDEIPEETTAPASTEAPDPTEPLQASNDIPEDSTLVSNPVNVEMPVYVMPAEGEIIKEFSMDKPIYNETMEDWRVHDGIDIACDEGAAVYAFSAGTVTGIDFDDMSGHFVSITHPNGYVSTYFGLNSNTTMKLNQEVAAGEQIGTAGNTMLSEIAQPCHIHFVITENGSYIDPLSIIE